MTCISITHYVFGFNSDKDNKAPAVFKKSQSHLDQLLKFTFGGFHGYKKTKHFASLNIISVSDPYEEDSIPVRCLTIPDVEQAERFVRLPYMSSYDISDDRSRLIDEYESLVLAAYPSLDVFEDNRQIRCARIWAIDVECVDYSMQTLCFTSEADAKHAIELFRSAM